MNWFGLSSLIQREPGSHRTLTIGVVNNASDRALKSTERQFLRLLRAASDGTELRFRFFTCREARPSARPQSTTGDLYSDIGELYDIRPDALIVTGMEPQSAALKDEPIWGSLARIADWAEARAVPVMWSCLAAHAAVLHLDGICRFRLPTKLSGIFESDVAEPNHRLMAGIPSRWVTPHSRCYGVSGDALLARGYTVLSQSSEAAVNIFLKTGSTTFVFVQGHPEYDGDTLLREFKRDVRRYIIGESNEFPIPPRHYFTTDSEVVLNQLRQDTLQGQRDLAILDVLSRTLAHETQSNTWHLPAVRFYANWLASIVKDDLCSDAIDRQSPPGSTPTDWFAPTPTGVGPNR
jgi:homoserine O-succinyltransferase